MNDFEKKELVRQKLQLLEKRTSTSFAPDFQSIYADLDSIEGAAAPDKYTWLKRFIKMLVLVFILKMSRKLLTTSSQNNAMLSEFIGLNGISIIYSLVLALAFPVVTFLAIYIFMHLKDWSNLLNHRVVIWCVSVITIDIVLVIVFPDITLAILKAYLKVE